MNRDNSIATSHSSTDALPTLMGAVSILHSRVLDTARSVTEG